MTPATATGIVYKKALNIQAAHITEAAPKSAKGDSPKSIYLTPGEYSLKITNIIVHGPASDPTWNNLKLEFKAANGAAITGLLSVPGESTFYKGKDGSNFNLPLKNYLEFLKSVGMADVGDLDKYTRALWKSFDATVAAKITIQAVLGYKKGTFHLGLTKGSGYSINDFNGVALTNDNGLPMFFEDKPDALAEMSARGLKQGYVDIKYFKGQGTSNILPGVAKVLPKAAESDDTAPF